MSYGIPPGTGVIIRTGGALGVPITGTTTMVTILIGIPNTMAITGIRTTNTTHNGTTTITDKGGPIHPTFQTMFTADITEPRIHTLKPAGPDPNCTPGPTRTVPTGLPPGRPGILR